MMADPEDIYMVYIYINRHIWKGWPEEKASQSHLILSNPGSGMSWFGLGGGSKAPEPPKKSYGETSFDNSPFDSGGGGDFASPSVPTRGGGGGFEDEILALSQQTMIQALMFKLTERGFEQCVTKPSSSLSCTKYLLEFHHLFLHPLLPTLPYPTNFNYTYSANLIVS